MGLGVGLSDYQDAAFASSSKEHAFVWSHRLRAGPTWQLRERWHLGFSVGLTSQLFDLKSSTDLPEFMRAINETSRPGEERMYIHRVAHNIHYALLGGNLQYAIVKDSEGGARLSIVGHLQVQQLVYSWTNSRFKVRSDSKGFFNLSPIIQDTGSKPVVDDYFAKQINKQVGSWELGLVIAAPYWKGRFYHLLSLSYERGLTEASQGLLGPAHSVRMSIRGFRFKTKTKRAKE